MRDIINNRIHIDKNMGLFVGKFNDNSFHKHYALQISISSQQQFTITEEDYNKNLYSICFINSNIKHKFESKETALIILINPLSTVGHLLYNKYENTKIAELDKDLEPLKTGYNNYLRANIDFQDLTDLVKNYFDDYRCDCEQNNHPEDDRIYKAIQYLEWNADRIVSLDEIASICCLSKTRFLHLFKEKTNLNYRRYQLWNKLIKSIPYLQKQSISKTALEFGFTDTAHYSRTFKETFGLTPKFLSSSK